MFFHRQPRYCPGEGKGHRGAFDRLKQQTAAAACDDCRGALARVFAAGGPIPKNSRLRS